MPIHEIGHTLGLYHEQNRPDRDQHVSIMWNNIQPSNYLQFEENTWTEASIYNTTYNTGSVMHYGATVSQSILLRNAIINN